MSVQDITVIILAAGSSSRMGSSKQLLVVNDEPLLRQTVQTAIDSGLEKVVVVLGADAEGHKKILKELPAEIVENKAWPSGMGSSIKAGIRYVTTNHANIQGVIILVCDQPLLKSDHIKTLIREQQHSDKSIVASGYAGTVGVPALFSKEVFPQLLALENGEGAKKIILKNKDAMVRVDFPEGEIDLDTPDDVEIFKKQIRR